MVGGHGKGYGFHPLKEGERPPPRKASGHAWNAVKIDNGYWKLLDACWGAGSVSGQSYNQHFSPHQFTASNEMFGYELPFLFVFLSLPAHFKEKATHVQGGKDCQFQPGPQSRAWCRKLLLVVLQGDGYG